MSDANPGAQMSGQHCEKCLQPVILGPHGGYVCGLCYHVIEPDGYAKHRAEGVKAAAEQRKARTLERRERKARSAKAA